MPVMVFRDEKYRLETVSLTLKEAAIVRRFTGLRPGAFQKAIEQMAEEEDIDGELMQAWLWITLRQNGKQIDVTDLDDVTLEEFAAAMQSVVESAKQEGTATVPDPTPAAADSVEVLPPSATSDSTGISSGSDTSTSSSSPTTAESPL